MPADAAQTWGFTTAERKSCTFLVSSPPGRLGAAGSREVRQHLIREQLEIVGLGEPGKRELDQVEPERLDLRQVIPKLGRVTREGRILSFEPVACPVASRRPVPIQEHGD